MNGPPRYGHAGWLFSASKLLSLSLNVPKVSFPPTRLQFLEKKRAANFALSELE